MVQIAISAANVTGDIGGAGISRLHWQRQDAATIAPADATAFLAAWRALWFAAAAWIPQNVTWSWQPQSTVIDHADASLQGLVTATAVPANVSGTTPSNYPAGNGARLNWNSGSVRNRRLMRAATFMVPLGSNGYTTGGQVMPTFITAMATASNTFFAALNTAQLELIVYHRPVPGDPAHGAVGLVQGLSIPTRPATLRSRRE
jgi:hypothetical protein